MIMSFCFLKSTIITLYFSNVFIMLSSEGHLQNRFQDGTCVDFHDYVPHCISDANNQFLVMWSKHELKGSKTIFFRPLYPCHSRGCVDSKNKNRSTKILPPLSPQHPIIAEPVSWHQKKDKAKTKQQKQQTLRQIWGTICNYWLLALC